jgi:autotransporter-associated beta strand protein
MMLAKLPRRPSTPSSLPRRTLGAGAAAAMLALASACGGGHSGSDAAAEEAVTTGAPVAGATDITAAILANHDVTLSGDAVISLPAGATTYTGVISGQGTLRLKPAGGTAKPGVLVITRTSTFTLPASRQVEVVSKTSYPGMGYALDIAGTNPPVLTIDPGATLRIGTNSSADQSPNILAVSDSLNPASLVNGELNLDNILDNGAIEINSANFVLLGRVSGVGSINELNGVWGGESPRGTSTSTGVLALSTGQDFGSNHVAASLQGAKSVVNEGSWLIWCPPGHVVTVSQDIYEAAYGNDINFHAIGTGRIVMTGVYSHTDNSPHGTPNLVDPGLSDPSLNLAKVIYRGALGVNGNDASYRGINIERGNIVQWGDGTTARFFLPSAPSPAEVSPALGKKNAYINLRGGALAFNYNGPVELDVGITGGGGGPHRDGSVGVGDVTIMGTPGNDVTFAQPQNYNGRTTIEKGAVLRLGSGKPVPLNYVTINNGVKSTALIATYSGDASLLTAQSAAGAAGDAIVDDGQLVVQNTAAAITLSGISGAGSLTQAGPATTTLMANSFSGDTTIAAGQVVAGDAHAFGSGSVANQSGLGVSASGVAVAIARSYVQSPGAVLTLPVDAVAGAARLEVSGTAALAGTLVLNFTGAPPSGQKLVLVSASGGLSGSFSSVVSNGATVRASQDGTRYYVTVQ